jgi:hypothetical protein
VVALVARRVVALVARRVVALVARRVVPLVARPVVAPAAGVDRLSRLPFLDVSAVNVVKHPTVGFGVMSPMKHFAFSD